MTFNAGIEAAALKWPNGCHDPDSCSRHKRCMYVQCRNLNRDIKDEIGEAVAEQNTRPSSSAPVEQREAVARIIDPEAWEVADSFSRDGDTRTAKDVTQDSFAKADAILSLPGSSRDEVLEEAAKIADQAMSEFSDLTDDLGIFRKSAASESATLCGMAAREIASAIRALKSGGAK